MAVRDGSCLPMDYKFLRNQPWAANQQASTATVTRDGFDHLFETQLEAATLIAEQRIGRSLPRAFRIRLYGPGHPRGEPITKEQALAVLWLGADRFFRIIDLAVSH